MELLILVDRAIRSDVLFFFIMWLMVIHFGMNVGDGGKNIRFMRVIMLMIFFFVLFLFWFIFIDLFFWLFIIIIVISIE
jgi:hypothetical protein